MVQLEILSGKTAGTTWSARRFPVRVGRSPQSSLQLEEHGVWENHFQISLKRSVGFVLETGPDALVTINGQPAQHAALRNGDQIELGGVKLQFWISEPAQKRLAIRESFVWAILLGVCLGQVALIYWLLQ